MIQFFEAEYRDVLGKIALARTEAHPDVPIAEPELKSQLRLRPAELDRHLELIEIDGEYVGFWMLLQEPMFREPHQRRFVMMVRPRYAGRGIEPMAVHKAIQLARKKGLSEVVAVPRSTEPAYCTALDQYGFVQFHRDIVSGLALDSFDAARFQTKVDGIDIVSGAKLDLKGSDWVTDAYSMHIELMADVPFASNYTAPSFESWSAKVRDPNLFDLHLMFFALEGTRFVGETTLFRFESNPDICLTGLTAVRRNYRRKGIALALKVTSFSQAKAMNVKEVHTGNEARNPAYLMNRKLGFRDLFDELGYRLNLI